jgi:hypothetical protein
MFVWITIIEFEALLHVWHCISYGFRKIARNKAVILIDDGVVFEIT